MSSPRGEDQIGPHFEEQLIAPLVKLAYKRRMQKAAPTKKSRDFVIRANLAFRILLQDEFVSRQRKNPNYSLRAMASHLKVDQSFLSKVLRGEKRFSLEVIESLGSKLGLSPIEVQNLGSGSPPSKYQLLEDDRFHMISDWYHFAILELAKTRGFSFDAKKIAQKLGLHIEETRAAIDRLKRLGFIETVNGKPRLAQPDNSWSTTKRTTEARRALQRKFLQMSLQALDDIEFDLRDHGSLTIAIDKNQLPRIKTRLIEIRKQLGDEFQSEGHLDEVYQLTISFFPVTKIDLNKEKSL